MRFGSSTTRTRSSSCAALVPCATKNTISPRHPNYAHTADGAGAPYKHVPAPSFLEVDDFEFLETTDEGGFEDEETTEEIPFQA